MRGVVLLQERAEHLGVGHVARPFHDEVLAPDHLAVANDEELEAGLFLLARDPDHVLLGPAVGGDLLLLDGALDGAQLVAGDAAALVLQRGRALVHLPPQVGGDRLLPALQEVDDAIDRGSVLAPSRSPGCRAPGIA